MGAARLVIGLGFAGLGLAGCGSDDGGVGVSVRRLRDAALLAEGGQGPCPLDLGFADALGGDVQPQTGDEASAGTSVGRAPAGSPLLAVGGASYRCGYSLNGKPVSLVVVAVPEGQDTAASVGALVTPLQEAGLDQGAAQALVDAAKGAKIGTGVAPSGSGSAASAALPGGGAASTAIVAAQGGPAPKDLTAAAEKLATRLSG